MVILDEGVDLVVYGIVNCRVELAGAFLGGTVFGRASQRA